MAGVKKEAVKLVDALAPDATWDDLMYEIYVRQAIESGLADSDAGEVKSVDAVREEFGLTRGEVDHNDAIDVRKLRGLLNRSRKRPVSVDSMNAAILREHARKR